jgi:hypothetical protein
MTMLLAIPELQDSLRESPRSRDTRFPCRSRKNVRHTRLPIRGNALARRCPTAKTMRGHSVHRKTRDCPEDRCLIVPETFFSFRSTVLEQLNRLRRRIERNPKRVRALASGCTGRETPTLQISWRVSTPRQRERERSFPVVGYPPLAVSPDNPVTGIPFPRRQRQCARSSSVPDIRRRLA